MTPEEIAEACMRLPERQREALALHGVERLSYEEIAARMGTSSGSVAQLISRARINLYDELRGTALASVAPPSPDCERALPLIAAREDGQLEVVSGDPAWLEDHLLGCDRCRLGEEQMREANASYCTLAPIATAGESQSGALPASMRSPSGAPSAPLSVSSRIRSPRGRRALAGALAGLLLLGGLAAAFVKDDRAPAPAAPAADASSEQGSGKSKPGAKSVKAGGEGSAAKEKAKAQTTAVETNGSRATAAGATPLPVTLPSQATTGGDATSGSPSHPTRPTGTAGVEATKQTSVPKSPSKPKPAPATTPASQPASGPAPTPEAPPPTEEPSDAPGRSGEAPGKPSGHPVH